MLYHAGTLSLGYGGLGLVLRKLVRAQQKKELENLGIPELPLRKAAQDVPGLFDRELAGTHSPAHLALTAAAVLAASYGGWKLEDYISDREEGEELDTRVSETKNAIDKMVFDEIQRTRGPQKAAALTAVCRCLEKESQYVSQDSLEDLNPGARPAGDWERPLFDFGGLVNLIKHPFRSAETAWWVWAAATFAVSYAAAKNFGDKADPNRRRLKEIENISKERAKVHGAPVLLDESSLTPVPSVRTESSNLRSTAAVPVQGVKTKTPVDATDPYASILQ